MTTEGLISTINDLIALKHQVHKSQYTPKHSSTKSGPHLSTIRGRGMDFTETRNYQAGDEIRHMEWRVTARTGRPHVKVYQEERERPVVIITDFNSSMYFGTRVAFKSVIAARLASLLAWTAIKNGDRVGGICFSATEHHEFIPCSRESGVLPFLAALSHYTQKPWNNSSLANRSNSKISFHQALLRAKRVIKPGSIVIVVSDFYSLNSEINQHLNLLCAHNDMFAYHICDPLELNPPKPQQYTVSNGQETLLLDTTLDSVRFAYQHRCEERIAAITKQLTHLNIQYITVDSQQDLPQIVRQTFPRRRRV